MNVMEVMMAFDSCNYVPFTPPWASLVVHWIDPYLYVLSTMGVNSLCLHVLRHVAGKGKSFSTLLATIRLFSRVFPHVHGRAAGMGKLCVDK